MTQTSVIKHVGHGGIGRRMSINSIAKQKKWEKTEICIIYRFMPLVFEGGVMPTEKIDVFVTIIISNIF
jgi:hypothetical protein